MCPGDAGVRAERHLALRVRLDEVFLGHLQRADLPCLSPIEAHLRAQGQRVRGEVEQDGPGKCLTARAVKLGLDREVVALAHERARR